ncbi:MAG TPA: hypothetical protein VGM90_05120 [Kofleriaceae bacterium]
MKKLAYLVAVAATTLLGACATEGGVAQDPKDDSFTTEGKEDAFGVEDWSPDGAAVIKFASTATKAQLQSAGLTAKVAQAILDQRNTLPGKKFTTLHQIDQAPYTGKTVFTALLKYAADKKLFKTALRIPLLVDIDSVANPVSITTYNEAARANNVTAFAPYIYVDVDTKYSDKMDAYNTRLQALAAKSGTPIAGEMKRYAYSLAAFENGTYAPCYVGDGGEAVDIASAHTDEMMSDMYIQWATRWKDKKWFDDNVDSSDFSAGTEWDNFDTDGDEFLVISSANDDGDSQDPALVGNCRK